MERTDARKDDLWRFELWEVGFGMVSGLLAGIGMGIVLQFGTDLIPIFGAVTGQVSLLRGWVVHLAMSALYGGLFAGLVGYPAIRDYVESLSYAAVLVGITYAVMIAAVTISLLPFVFRLPWVAVEARESLQLVPGPGFQGLLSAAVFALAHIVYGALLGWIYDRVSGVFDT